MPTIVQEAADRMSAALWVSNCGPSLGAALFVETPISSLIPGIGLCMLSRRSDDPTGYRPAR